MMTEEATLIALIAGELLAGAGSGEAIDAIETAVEIVRLAKLAAPERREVKP